ncbi:hypothetical protein OO012_02580 [Rhodobacteraceae bacterium KMM 6894]|nr:hypothetical protein [Rhodobacteraceae bacterium KMM 6894]
MKSFLTIAVATTVLALGTAAQADTKFMAYSLSKKRAEIKGAYFVDGYTTSDVQRFVAQDCNGKIGQMKLLGKPRKKRGHLVQKFSIDCPGGPAARYPGAMSIEIEQMADGKHLAEMSGSDGMGNMVYSKEFRKP